MSQTTEMHNVAALPDDVRQNLLSEGSDVQTKVGPVAQFHPHGKARDLEETRALDELVQYKKPKETQQFVGLTKEELKVYINDPKWKRIRWIIALLYILVLVLLLVGAIYLVVTSQRCPPKPKLNWYEQNIIYEIDVTNFDDSDADGNGDLQGVKNRLSYLEKNQIKAVLLQSSIFGDASRNAKTDLRSINSTVGTDKDFQELAKALYRQDMALLVDLPISSTFDRSGRTWYASAPLRSPITNPCARNRNNMACRFFESYGRLPLDFADAKVNEEAMSRIEHWLSTKKVDGIRVDVPLKFNTSTNSYDIDYETVQRWNDLQSDISKKSKPKLILYDVPVDLQIKDNRVLQTSARALTPPFNQRAASLDAPQLFGGIQSISSKPSSTPAFWQLGSSRARENLAAITDAQLSREMLLTLAMLSGGTPVLLYGEEIGLNRQSKPLMAWTSDGVSRGFSTCNTAECNSRFQRLGNDPSKNSVKRQEAVGGNGKDSLLTVFRYLAKLRQSESFQHGLFQTGCDRQSNLLWFIREAPGHRGYIVLLNLNANGNDLAHLSLPALTKDEVPNHVHYEYQSPKTSLSTFNHTHIDSDNLLLHPQSINIFSWAPKLIKPDELIRNAKAYQHTC